MCCPRSLWPATQVTQFIPCFSNYTSCSYPVSIFPLQPSKNIITAHALSLLTQKNQSILGRSILALLAHHSEQSEVDVARARRGKKVSTVEEGFELLPALSRVTERIPLFAGQGHAAALWHYTVHVCSRQHANQVHTTDTC